MHSLRNVVTLHHVLTLPQRAGQFPISRTAPGATANSHDRALPIWSPSTWSGTPDDGPSEDGELRCRAVEGRGCRATARCPAHRLERQVRGRAGVDAEPHPPRIRHRAVVHEQAAPEVRRRGRDQQLHRSFVDDRTIDGEADGRPPEQVRDRPADRPCPAACPLGSGIRVAPRHVGVPAGTREEGQPTPHPDEVDGPRVAGEHGGGDGLGLARQAQEVRRGVAEARRQVADRRRLSRPARCRSRPACRRPRPRRRSDSRGSAPRAGRRARPRRGS